jgi:hypothetical protein
MSNIILGKQSAPHWASRVGEFLGQLSERRQMEEEQRRREAVAYINSLPQEQRPAAIAGMDPRLQKELGAAGYSAPLPKTMKQQADEAALRTEMDRIRMLREAVGLDQPQGDPSQSIMRQQPQPQQPQGNGPMGMMAMLPGGSGIPPQQVSQQGPAPYERINSEMQRAMFLNGAEGARLMAPGITRGQLPAADQTRSIGVDAGTAVPRETEFIQESLITRQEDSQQFQAQQDAVQRQFQAQQNAADRANRIKLQEMADQAQDRGQQSQFITAMASQVVSGQITYGSVPARYKPAVSALVAAQGGSIIPGKVRERMTEFNSADAALESIESALVRWEQAQTPEEKTKAAINFNGKVQGFSTIIGRSVGNKGVFTDQDQARMESTIQGFPGKAGVAYSLSDPEETKRRLSEVHGLFNEISTREFDQYLSGSAGWRPGNDISGQPKVGDEKTFPNGRRARFDGKGWMAIQ